MTEEELNDRLTDIFKRLQWIADEESRSAWVNGAAAHGLLDPERSKLVDEADDILDALEKIQKFPQDAASKP